MRNGTSRRVAFVATALVTAAAAGLGLVYGCGDDDATIGDGDAGNDTSPAPTGTTPDPGTPDTGGGKKPTARAILLPTTDAGKANGIATFVEENGAVTATITISGGLPEGLHGMHIHQVGNCGPSDAGGGNVTPGGAAGGHWNLYDAGHGYPDAAVHHIGDMGNILITDAGIGVLTLVSDEWTVGTGATSVVGHAVVFHGGTDDGVSQPVGDAGPRPGCGVIELVPQ